ncbi:hypothetical protein AB0M45_18130 [Nocardia sp. NPDC051787]|uniref:hypothetical protein n=1 Tax=Nocardia sp. NPDC051787 TaxID=3155415 RepID=UPI00341B8388
MSSDDTPDNLSPAEREQYFRYAAGKYGRDEAVRTPFGWRDKSAEMRTQWIAGKAVQLGLGQIYGMEALGAKPEVTVKAGEQTIRVDWRIPARDLVVAINIETKGGRFDQQRDLVQLQGYAALLAQGQKVVYFIRASKEPKLSKDVREQLAKLEKQYPKTFTVQRASEKVFARVFQAGMRQVQREHQQKLRENIAKLPAREANALTVEQIARDYLREIQQAKAEGRPIGIDQLRFMHEALRDLSGAQGKLDREQADRDRQVLGLRYHESREVEQFLALKAQDQQDQRGTAIDRITHELLDRDREELAKAAKEVAQQIAEAQQRGATLEVEQLRQQHLALGNALGNVQNVERQMFQDIANSEVAKGLPEKEAKDWLLAMDLIQKDRDHGTAQQIDNIREAAEREEKAREDARVAAEQAREAAQRREAQLRELGQRLPPEVVKLLGDGQAQPPDSAVRHRPDDTTPRVARSGRHGPEQSRGLDRGR